MTTTNNAVHAIRRLINSEAARLQKHDPTLTDAQARTAVRKRRPEWTDLERRTVREGTKAQQLRMDLADQGRIETIRTRIDTAIAKRADWYSIQPGTHSGTGPSGNGGRSHKRTVASSPVVTTCIPSGLNLAKFTGE